MIQDKNHRILMLALTVLLLASLACSLGGTATEEPAEREVRVVTSTPEGGDEPALVEDPPGTETSNADGSGEGQSSSSSSGPSSSQGSGSQPTQAGQHTATSPSGQGNQGAHPTATSPPTHTSAPGQPTNTPPPTYTSVPPTSTYTPTATYTSTPPGQLAPEDARFNNPLDIPLDNTASVLDFVSYPGGDTEDRVRWDVIGMNTNSALPGGRARLVISVSCFGQNTNQIEFFTGGQTYSCGQTIVDREVTSSSKTGSVVITAVGGSGTYVQWVLTGTATRIN